MTLSHGQSSQVLRIVVGSTLVFGPIAILVAAFAMTGSAVIASIASLSVSPVLQLVAERRWPRLKLPARSRRQLATDAFLGIVYGSLLGVSVIFGLWWALQSLRVSMGIEVAVAGSVWIQAAVVVVVADFVDYFRHRHEHESSGLFWRVHSVHHSIRHFSLLDGLALHPLETLCTYASYGVVAGALGLSFEGTLIGFTLALIVMAAQHTNTDSSLGPLSSVLAHTDGHRWHHDIALESGRNVNYANVFSAWDRLWGSHYAPRDFDGEYGISPFWDAYPKTLLDQALIVLPHRYSRAESDGGRVEGWRGGP